MSLRSAFNPAVARLVTGSALATTAGSPTPLTRGPFYRPLIAGPAILQRVDRRGKWLVAVSTDGLLRPLVPGTVSTVRRLIARQRRAGILCRIGLALVTPDDVLHAAAEARGSRTDAPWRAHRSARQLRLDIYGWSLMIQLPGMQGIAMIDADDTIDALPAFYESPLELVDRANHLAARHIPSRPIAIVTRPEDFQRGDDGRLLNRFHPRTCFHRPFSLDALL